MIRHRPSNASIDISAAALASMIDIIFQLIIFFVVTASFDAEQVDGNVKLPQVSGSVAARSVPPERIIINVHPDGTVINGFQTIPPGEVSSSLPAILKQAASGRASMLIVNGDADARHRVIAPVLTAAAEAGFTDIRINSLVMEVPK